MVASLVPFSMRILATNWHPFQRPSPPDSQKPPTETKSIPLEKEKQGSVRQGVSQEAPDGPILVNPA